MYNDFLSTLLKIVVVLDIVGVVAYFAMGLARPARERAMAATPGGETASVRPLPGRSVPGVGGLRRYLGPRLGRRRPAAGETLDAALGKLRRVLLSYQEGLA